MGARKLKHVVVIGAGIVGLCAADSLLRRGFRVTVIERDATPGEGCSYGNGGLIVPSHFEPLAAPGMVMTGLRMLRSKESPFGFAGFPGLEMAGWMARFMRSANAGHVERSAPILRDMNLASRALYENRYADVEAGYERLGELMVCRTEAALAGESRLAKEANHLGLKTTVMTRRDLADFDKGIEYDAAGAVYFEDDAHLTPPLFMPALRARVIAAGAEVREGVEVKGFRTKDGKIEAALLDGGELPADEFVLAAGSWTGKLATKLGLRLPLLAGKGYGFTVKQPPAIPSYPAILVEGRVAVTPMRDGVRFVGTMELGLPGPAVPNESRLRGMRKAIADAYPVYRDFDLTQIPAWSGLRPCAPDGMPYIGRSGRIANAIFATGHGMMGMSLGPVSGEMVAEVAENALPSIPLALLSPDRYA
ncbi:FAD-dependent oxidoreductase [bacterium]|nr:MAG: FAD-dependent oxidoreductase [bacterium]